MAAIKDLREFIALLESKGQLKRVSAAGRPEPRDRRDHRPGEQAGRTGAAVREPGEPRDGRALRVPGRDQPHGQLRPHGVGAGRRCRDGHVEGPRRGRQARHGPAAARHAGEHEGQARHPDEPQGPRDVRRQGDQEGPVSGGRASRRRRRPHASCRCSRRGRRTAVRSSRCRSWSRATSRASPTSACTGCRSSTRTRPGCTSTSTTTARRTCARGARRASTRVPVSVALGADPVTIFSATAPVPPMIDEYLFAGILRGESVEVVKCVTNDLLVPAHAEIVLEGWCRPRGDALGGTVRRPHRLLLARRLLPGLPRRGDHDAPRRRSTRRPSSARRPWRTTTSARRPSGSSCRSSRR